MCGCLFFWNGSLGENVLEGSLLIVLMVSCLDINRSLKCSSVDHFTASTPIRKRQQQLGPERCPKI